MPDYKVLITGSSGFIGTIVSKHLIDCGYYVSGFDKEVSHNNTHLNKFICGDIVDLELLRESARGMDCIIHLAAFSDDGDFIEDLLNPNIIGVFNVFETARLENVSQIFLASSTQTADIDFLNGPIDVKTYYPTNHYALLKIWAENLGRMYSMLYNISVLSIRLGWVLKSHDEVLKMTNNKKWKQLYLSHNDLRRFFTKCLNSTLPLYATIYALSIQEDYEQFNMQPGRQLIGYEPCDIFPRGLDFL